MSILSVLFLSAKKTKKMNKAAKLMLNPNISSMIAVMKHEEKMNKTFEDLFRIMSVMPGFSNILQKHNATSKDLMQISSRVQLAGYTFADNGDYIPVAVVSFGAALDYVLENKEKVLNYSYAEVIEVIENIIPIL